VLKKIILAGFILSSLYAKDYVDIYRKEGITKVEQELQSALMDKSYWLGYLQDKNVTLGYYETIKYILLTNKKTKQLRVFDNESYQLNEILNHGVIVGKYEGDKQDKGDLKTPTGVYDLKAVRKDMGDFYGPLAFVTDYPNMLDRTKHKSGYGIWLHGYPLDANTTRNAYTKGCIALKNHALLKLGGDINYRKSVLLINSGHFQKASKDEIASILAFVYTWRKAWEDSDFDTYISFYSQDFKSSKGKNLTSFTKYKRRLFAQKEKKTIKLSRINISPYPNSYNKRIFRITMGESYHTKRYGFDGDKVLYIELKDGKIYIIVEG